MGHSAVPRFARRAVIVAVIACLFAASAPASVGARPAAVARPPAAASVSGRGFWHALACLGCASAFLIMGGTTVVGVAVAMAANAELAAACLGTCAAAMS